ncbi:MAG: lipoate--protein ligase family protein [bacterium]
MFNKNTRYIPFLKYSPYENMAIDEYMISYYEKIRQPVFRLYAWSPAGISVGKNQEVLKDINLENCKSKAVPVVRRITGGGAIYHNNEVTYSIVCSEKDLSENNLTVKESFEKVNQFILKMYAKCGLVAAYAKEFQPAAKQIENNSAFCFASNEEYDIIIKGKKIGGNAQARKKDLIFQHGSIPIKPSPQAMDYFNKKENSDNYSDLSTIASRDISEVEVCANMVAAFAETFSCSLEIKPLEIEEKHEVVALLTSKYAINNWNLKQ